MEAIQKQTDLEALFRDAADDLARYFSRRHERGGDSAQDLVQETFVEMARGLSKGSQPESPRGYLFGIARRVSQAAWRRSYREREAVSLDIPTETLAAPKVDDRIAAAHELIAAMPDLQREILDLRFSQQLSYAEIAEALDIPLGTVRSRLHHALIAVRERLAEDEHES